MKLSYAKFHEVIFVPFSHGNLGPTVTPDAAKKGRMDVIEMTFENGLITMTLADKLQIIVPASNASCLIAVKEN